MVAAPAALLLLAGCGLGKDAPHPGVAAEVDGQTLSLSDLETLVDAACTANAHDPRGQVTTRGNAAAQEVAKWIGAQVVIADARRHGVPVPSTVQDLSTVPGWDTMSADEQKALQDFVDQQSEANAIVNADPSANNVDATDFDVIINPRFDLGISATKFVPTDQQLSVAVSKEALAETTQPTLQQLQAMPASQVCGTLPTTQQG
jgi:hypothetical protein